ncbi:MAG: hypothetical protein ACK5ME_04590 [Parahaliea sp.]
MDTGLLVFDRTHLPGEKAMHPLVLLSVRQAVLLNQSAAMSRLA